MCVCGRGEGGGGVKQVKIRENRRKGKAVIASYTVEPPYKEHSEFRTPL